MGATCSFEYTPAATDGELTARAEPWSCDRQPHRGGRCIFHLSDEAFTAVGPEAIRDALLAALTEGGEHRLELLGARFGPLDLADRSLDAPEHSALDLRGASFEGPVDLSNATVAQPLLLDNATFEESLDLEQTTFAHRTGFRGVQCEGAVDAQYVAFEGPTDFRGATFAGAVSFLNGTFGDTAWFGGAERARDDHRPVPDYAATFEAGVSFGNVQFGDAVDFTSARLGDAQFTRAHFDGMALFIATSFQQARFGYADFQDAYFRGVTFEDTARFDRARFARETTFAACAFADRVTFRRAHFDEAAQFLRVDCTRMPTFKNATFAREAHLVGKSDQALVLSGVTVNGDLRLWWACRQPRNLVECTNATVQAGELGVDLAALSDDADLRDDLRDATDYADGPSVEEWLTTGYPVYLDLKSATLGPVTLTAGDDQAVFDHVRILGTRFDGFEFGDYRGDLRNHDWRLHDLSPPPEPTATEGDTDDIPDDTPHTSPSAAGSASGGDTEPKEATDGSATDDPTSGMADIDQGELAVTSWWAGYHQLDAADLETTYQRAKNGANQVGDSTAASQFFIKEKRYRRADYDYSLRGAAGALTNWLFDLVCVYGERPSRVVATSVATIVAFAVPYWVVGTTSSGGLLAALLFSGEIFVTLLVGQPEVSTASRVVQVAAVVEGFLGAFLIALFVFTLTRSIHR